MSNLALFIGMFLVLLSVCGFAIAFIWFFAKLQSKNTAQISAVLGQTVTTIVNSYNPPTPERAQADVELENQLRQLYDQTQDIDADYDPANPGAPWPRQDVAFGPPSTNGHDPLLPMTEADLNGPFFG